MAVSKIALPSEQVSNGKLTVVMVMPSTLVRVSGHDTAEPHFGASGSSRFDAPGCLAVPPSPEFKTSYFGFSLAVAIAETLLHDEIADGGCFKLAPASLASKYVVSFKGKALKLADLTGAPLKRLGGHGDLSGTDNYDITQRWSLAVFRNPGNFDGFIYMSRHLTSDRAAVLFDRANKKIRMKRATSLLASPGFAQARELFNIVSS